MSYIFFGTPEFAAIIVDALCKGGIPPRAAVVNPDRPQGRKQVLTPPPVKRLIAERKLPVNVLQPEVLDSAFFGTLAKYQPDFFVVAAYAKILPKELLAMPPRGAIGVHPSLLPRFRGTTPIQSAILSGDAETGTTVFLLDEHVDHGPTIAQARLAIGEKNYAELLHELAHMSGRLLVDTLPRWERGEITPEPQDESRATFTKKFRPDDGFVPLETVREAYAPHNPQGANLLRKIRALNPEPGVYTIQDGRRIKLLEAKFDHGTLRITKIQRDGEKPRNENGGWRIEQ